MSAIDTGGRAMLFHMSMPAQNPAHVAAVIAELWGGESFPFPPYPGSFTAMAGDERNTSIEVYPIDTQLVPAQGQADAVARRGGAGEPGACHVAFRTPLSEPEVHAIAAREGWIAKTLSRGGVFRVIEFWVENQFMFEVLTAEMEREYLERVTVEGWRAMLESGPPA
jgi:hypothetical protein